MPLPSSGSISLSQVNVELGRSATAAISMNESAVRTLFGVASGAISMSQGYGKANEFAFTISANQTNANLRTLAVNAGWNQISRVVATIASGIYVSSNATGTAALTVSGSFPNGVQLNNNGFIVGMGGAGGAGRSVHVTTGSGGAPGSAGGLALSVSTAISITNNGTIGGGGGGGGGGAGGWDSGGKDTWSFGGGGGGGGRSGAAANSVGGAGGIGSGGTILRNGNPGGAGTVSSAGGGGQGGTYQVWQAGWGGAGGGWGAAGSSGSGIVSYMINAGGPFGGGAAGAAVSGNSNITWLATGTRLGAIA